MNLKKKPVRPPVGLSHVDRNGSARMVSVGEKPVQHRRATAAGRLVCQRETIRLLKEKALPKGDVLTVANVAGVQAVKRTAELIPLCHPLLLTHIALTFQVTATSINITCSVETDGQTGVEMEALTGVSVAALTLYDMCKAVDKTMSIEDVCVVEKIKQ
jgi:cyclic pyranopterin phosphate synthase